MLEVLQPPISVSLKDCVRSREWILTNSFSNVRLNMKIYLTTILCAIALVSCADQATAQCGNGFGYGGYGFYNYGIQPYVPAPPYFALHPPVYYGARHTRPYGDSPFASPSQLQPSAGYAPTRHVERSLTVDNPYAVLPMAPETMQAPMPMHEPQPAPAPVNTVAPSPVVVKPLIIDNPYFQPEVKIANGKK